MFQDNILSDFSLFTGSELCEKEQIGIDIAKYKMNRYFNRIVTIVLNS